MQTTIKNKILVVFLLLTLLVIMTTSGAYYYLIIKDVREFSHNQIEIAFEMMLDDAESQMNRTLPRLEDFINERLGVHLSVLTDSLKLVDSPGTVQDKKYLSQLQSLMPISSGLVSEIDKFIPLLGANEFVLYGKDRKVISVYRRTEDQKVSGIYFHHLHDGTFISLHTSEEISATWAWQNIQDIPEIPLPTGVSALYEGEIPTKPIATFGTLGTIVTLKLTVPIFQMDEIQGICVLHIGIGQGDVMRYSHFSQTEVNVFANNSLSVGTLSDYSTITFEESEPSYKIDLFHIENMWPIVYSTVTVNNHKYDQGKIFFGNEKGVLGAITANFPRQIEKEKGDELIRLVLGIMIGLSILTVVASYVLSSKIVHPITNLTSLLHQITQGNLKGILNDSLYKKLKKAPVKNFRKGDEIYHLLQSFYEMVLYLSEIVVVADNISQGEIYHDIRPRSKQDMLGQAFHQMSEYLQEIASIATDIANGDLRQDIQPKSERDVLGNAFHKMEALRQAMSHIMHGSEHVREASKNLNQISVQMASATGEVSEKTHVVSSTSQQISQTVNKVATAVEEFSASIGEISRNTFESAHITKTAVDIARSASAAIIELESHSQEIGEISKVITAITQQTNLLALNAAIEAARAGDLGRGFTVVADEVKTLAKEIAVSAESITHKIEIVQSGSQKAVQAIGEVTKIITKIDDISSAIASSVEQQTATANEIARNISDAAAGSEQVSLAIVDVSTVTSHTSEQAANVEQSAYELTQFADQLQKLVEQFRI